MEPLISVIVPIYNVKAYLDRCVESLLGQSYKDLEIFLVDDGSTDGCGKVCDRYAAQDPRITVIHKKNGGLSDARNAALDAAQGEYYAFVDGDDWVSPYYVENLYRALRKADADMAVSCFEEVFEGRGIQSQPAAELKNFQSLTPEACLRRMLYQDGVETSTPTKLYKGVVRRTALPGRKALRGYPSRVRSAEAGGPRRMDRKCGLLLFSACCQHPECSVRPEEAGRRGTLPCDAGKCPAGSPSVGTGGGVSLSQHGLQHPVPDPG